MNSHYQHLELDQVILQISKHASFSLSKEAILALEVDFNPLQIKRNQLESRQALEMTVRFSKMPFLGVKNCYQALSSCMKGQTLAAQDLLHIADLNRASKHVLGYMKSVEGDFDAIVSYTSTLAYYKEIEDAISSSINNYAEVMDSASITLKQLKHSLGKIERQIQTSLQQFMKDNADSLQENTVVYRNNRACVLLKSSLKNTYHGFIHGDSASKQASYVEPGFLVTLNNQKQTIENDIEEEIKRILEALSALVKGYAESLMAHLDTLVYLDVLFAKASYGVANNAIVAEISTHRDLSLKNARHPLIDPKEVVSNSYHLDQQHHCLLITGSNTGGKTVSLKIIGLFVLMSYLGIPILCDDAQIPLFDHVFEDISDGQSIVESLSTFSAHLKKLSYITRCATSKSLVLLDELGSGTDPKDGESLAISILDYLRNKKTMVVCTTHFGRLKLYGQKHKDIILGSVAFDEEKLRPTYRFIEGLVGQSNAFAIAKRFSFDPLILQQAEKLKEDAISQDEQLVETLQIKIAQQVALNDSLKEKEEALKNQLRDLHQQQERIEASKEKILEEARIKAQAYIVEKQEEANLYIDELKTQNFKFHDALKVKKELDNLQEIESFDEISDEELHLNDYVKMNHSNQVGQIIQLQKKNAIVDVNGVKMTVKLDSLRKTVSPVQKKIQPKKREEFKATTMPLECHLIGLNSDEAYEVLSKYVDDALVNQLKYFRVVHGVGHGILRKMVHQYLKSNPQVKSFSLAMAHEGGHGATVVELL
ncbi:MAG: Smr/MutS family protein [Erysipelotrichaceae bacterium]